VFKTIGYVISSLSVVLLGVASWDGVKDKPVLLSCLIAGLATSIGGMLLRWASFLKDEKPSQRSATASLISKLKDAARPAPAPGRGSAEPPPKAR
jgi:hypothetical protein